MLKLKYILVFSLSLLFITAGCGREEAATERTFRGQIKVVPAPGSETLEKKYQTDVVIIELEDGEILIPVGEKAAMLQRTASGKNILFKGTLRDEKKMYRNERREVVDIAEILSIDD